MLKLPCVRDRRVLCDDSPENQYGFFITYVGCEQIVTEKSKDMARGNTQSVMNPDLPVPKPSHFVILLTHLGRVSPEKTEGDSPMAVY